LSRFSLTARAWRELDAVWRYIAKHSERHADLVEDAILATCKAAAEMPALGHRRPGIGNPRVLFLAVPNYENYFIAYLLDSKPLQVVRVVHGARDVPRLFR
jgi:plasmid stabilization system protein ParE